MRNARRILALLAVMGFCFVACGYVAVRVMATIGVGGTCVNEVIQEVVSPDRSHTAVLFLQNCGATVDYTSHVTILKVGNELRNHRGNVLRGIGSSAYDQIDIAWQNDGTLMVFHEVRNERIRKQESRVDGVTILYGTCRNEIASELRSPDGTFKAVVFLRYCGTNDAYSTHVSVLPSTQEIGEGHGNVFQAPAGADDRIGLSWPTSRLLVISHRNHPQGLIRQKSYQFDVQIQYEAKTE